MDAILCVVHTHAGLGELRLYECAECGERARMMTARG